MSPPDPHQQAAEQVRAHLVLLRGGAPFLSALDGRLLAEWLEAGIPASTIIAATEDAAERRRRRRVRAPLSLASARGALKRRLAAGPPPPVSPAGIEPLVALLRAHGGALEARAAATLEELAGRPGSGDLAGRALDTCRELLQEGWRGCDRSLLRRRAEEQLAGLREACTERQWARAVEEVARDLFRQEHPLLSARAIWDTVAR